MPGWIRIVLGLILGTSFSPGAGWAEPQLVDRIIAVVDNEVILHSDVMGQMALAGMNQGMDVQGMAKEEQQQLYGTILDNMIQEKILMERAETDSLIVDDERIEEAVRSRMRQLREEYGNSELSDLLSKDGLAERDLRDRFRSDYRKDFLRQQMYQRLSEKVSISSRDIEAFRTEYAGKLPNLLSVSHILIEVQPSDSQSDTALAKVNDLLERARAGEDFAALAQANSDDPGSRETGGDLGFFGKGRMFPSFEEAAFALKPGEIGGPVQTKFGYHILLGVERDGDRVRVRHILVGVKTTDADREAARLQALELSGEAQAGGDFPELARTHSADVTTARYGGRLGTYMVTSLPPSFADAIRQMTLGEISDPVWTDVGWLVLRLDDDQESLEEILGQLKLQEKFEEVIAETRQRLYVDVRVTGPLR